MSGVIASHDIDMRTLPTIATAIVVALTRSLRR